MARRDELLAESQAKPTDLEKLIELMPFEVAKKKCGSTPFLYASLLSSTGRRMRILHNHSMSPTQITEKIACFRKKNGAASSGAYICINTAVTILEVKKSAATAMMT